MREGLKICSIPSAVIPPQGLTWSLDWLFGGGVLPFVLNGRGIWHPRGRAVLTEMVLQPLDGAVELHRADLEVNRHEIWGDKVKIRLWANTEHYMVKQTLCAPIGFKSIGVGPQVSILPSHSLSYFLQKLLLPSPAIFIPALPPHTTWIPPLPSSGTDRRYLCKTLSIQVLSFQHERLYTLFRIQGTREFNEVLVIWKQNTNWLIKYAVYAWVAFDHGKILKKILRMFFILGKHSNPPLRSKSLRWWGDSWSCMNVKVHISCTSLQSHSVPKEKLVI